MSTGGRFLYRLFRGPLRALVRDALEEIEAERQRADGALDALYRYRIHGDPWRVRIDRTAVVNNALFNVSSGHITIERYAFFGHNVSVLTGTHDIHKFGEDRQRAIPRGGRDIVIREGAWLASDVLVLGPCVIGEHAVVGAGSLVLGDVEPYTVVAGRPARALRRIDPPQKR
jgi:acetyltransferase-like isoleucine patch superfamily enzyme